MVVEADVPAFERLVNPGAELTCIGQGYQFSEGPVWDPRSQQLFFSDLPGDARWRWSAEHGMVLDASPTFRTNGLVIDRSGALICCEQVTSSVVRLRQDGGRDLLAFHHRGKYLNSPNDIVVRRADGAIYFSDPEYGRWNDWIGQERNRDLDVKGVYRVAETGSVGDAELMVAEGEFDEPNGLCFSPDERILYVNDSDHGRIKAFDVADDGSLSGARVFFEGVGSGFTDEDSDAIRQARHQELHDAGAVDGMKCDAEGNVWVTGPGGVWAISPEAERIGRIRTPEVAGNLTWGGPDLRTLFVMTSTTVHSIPTLVGPPQLAHYPAASA
jgi:gluconolactonase